MCQVSLEVKYIIFNYYSPQTSELDQMPLKMRFDIALRVFFFLGATCRDILWKIRGLKHLPFSQKKSFLYVFVSSHLCVQTVIKTVGNPKRSSIFSIPSILFLLIHHCLVVFKPNHNETKRNSSRTH